MAQPQTALAAAFQAAGYEPPHDQLVRIAVEALARNPRSLDGARDAIWRGVQGDAALQWEFFSQYRKQAADALIQEAAAELRRQAAETAASALLPTDAMRTTKSAQPRRAPSASHPNSALTSEATQPRLRSSEPNPIDRNARRIEALGQVVRKLSKLDTFKVNGKPIGDCTPEEANGWAASRERDARFVRMLTSNMPPGRPIREFADGDAADQLYERAAAEAA